MSTKLAGELSTLGFRIILTGTSAHAPRSPRSRILCWPCCGTEFEFKAKVLLWQHAHNNLRRILFTDETIFDVEESFNVNVYARSAQVVKENSSSGFRNGFTGISRAKKE
ncbi:hypothetical protein TNCV_224481 [Trichonephila clavipes]|nr:hypothetical protein TNCV_224481 [Trichonephila clavipes]